MRKLEVEARQSFPDIQVDVIYSCATNLEQCFCITGDRISEFSKTKNTRVAELVECHRPHCASFGCVKFVSKMTRTLSPRVPIPSRPCYQRMSPRRLPTLCKRRLHATD